MRPEYEPHEQTPQDTEPEAGNSKISRKAHEVRRWYFDAEAPQEAQKRRRIVAPPNSGRVEHCESSKTPFFERHSST